MKAGQRKPDSIGLACEVFEYPEDVDRLNLNRLLKKSGQQDIHGILMFSPLPKSLDEKKIRASIP